MVWILERTRARAGVQGTGYKVTYVVQLRRPYLHHAVPSLVLELLLGRARLFGEDLL